MLRVPFKLNQFSAGLHSFDAIPTKSDQEFQKKDGGPLQIVILFSRKEYLNSGGNVELDYIELGTKYLNNGPRNIFDKYTNFVLKIRKILKIYKYF